ncbi:MAG: hypothetical protein WD598_17765 [Acidimicrobiia bacterium]
MSDDRSTPLATPAERAAAARLEFRPVAARLASEVVSDVSPFDPGKPLTALAEWFIDGAGGRVAVVVGSHEAVEAMDAVLAYALAWQGDRDLVLVLPETHADPTLRRLPWVATPIRVFTYGPELVPHPAVVPARYAVLDAAAQLGLRSTSEHDLGDAAELVEAVTAWADQHWALVPAHRSTYRAWHCAGRQVLTLRRSGGGARIVAGVAYRKAMPPGEERPLELTVTPADALTSTTRSWIEARVSTAVWKRLAGYDKGHIEHRLQASLAATGLAGLGVDRFAREYPAWRGAGRPGFIDFLAADRRNQLHVVETKVDPDDVTVVVQALDYATWVTANGTAIRAERGWPDPTGDERVILDFVCAPRIDRNDHTGSPAGKGVAIGPYLAGQLEALAGEMQWRTSIVSDPIAQPPDMSKPTWRTIPRSGPLVAAPVQPSRWFSRIQTDLIVAS